jgi:Na+/melibiose symporter-like transporter
MFQLKCFTAKKKILTVIFTEGKDGSGFLIVFILFYVWGCLALCVCVCVCVRERERESTQSQKTSGLLELEL